MENEYRIGVDIGGTTTTAAVVSGGEIVNSALMTTDPRRSFEEIIRAIAGTVGEAARSAGVSLAGAAGLGVGVPGTIDHRTGRVVYADNLGWRGVDVAAELEKHIGIRALIANDADCALIAEARAGAAREYTDCVMLTLGTGVGGAVLVGGELYAGGDGFGCEPGHTTVVVDGLQCACGRRGCLECYCSATALIREARSAALASSGSMLLALAGGDIEKIDGRTPFDAARAGDMAAQGVVANFIHFLAAGISGYIASIRPQAFIIGGGVSRAGDELFVPLRREVRSMVYSPETLGVADIVPAALGDRAGVIGAALIGSHCCTQKAEII